MARYTGPKVKISRRLNVNVYENPKGDRALERRPFPPGDHGRSRRRQPSEYLIQLQEKQKAKYIYGVLEKQFRNIYAEASRAKGVTGENLLAMLELRLDNIVYRAGWAATRPQARQFVNHGFLNVNGKRLDIASYRARKGDRISVRENKRELIVIRHNMDTLDRITPGWLETADNGFEVVVSDVPTRAQIDVPVREQLIIELYSK